MELARGRDQTQEELVLRGEGGVVLGGGSGRNAARASRFQGAAVTFTW